MTTAACRIILLKSSDKQTFEVEEAIAIQSQTIKHLIEDDCADSVIPLPNVTSKIMSKVIEYLKRHVEVIKSGDTASIEDLKNFDADFVKVDQGTLFKLILAANYLNIKSMLGLTCESVENMMKGKSIEEIRETFNIVNILLPRKKKKFAGRMHGHSFE